MKNVIALILILSLVFSLVACGQQTDNSHSNDTLKSSNGQNKLSDDIVWIDGISFVNLTPGSETVCSEKIEIVSDDTDFIYHLTYGRQNLILTFGLRDADGTEYSLEVVGGSDNGVIENIPAGNYDLFVRNSGDYSEFPAYKDNSVSYDAAGAINYSLGD